MLLHVATRSKQGNIGLRQIVTTNVALVMCTLSHGVLICSLCPVPISTTYVLFVTSVCSCDPKEVIRHGLRDFIAQSFLDRMHE